MDLAHVLPLPGMYGGDVTVGETMVGIFLKDGKDSTKEISAEPIALDGDSGIVIELGDNSALFYTKSQVERKLVVNPSNLSTSLLVDLKTPLVSGCDIFLSKGTIIIPVVDGRTGEHHSTVTYTIEDRGIIGWRKDRIMWSGFTVTVTIRNKADE